VNEHKLLEDWAANDCVRWSRDEDNYDYIPNAIKAALDILEVSSDTESEGQ
jgi:hypothetical protein